jgi:hypothetical protein
MFVNVHLSVQRESKLNPLKTDVHLHYKGSVPTSERTPRVVSTNILKLFGEIVGIILRNMKIDSRSFWNGGRVHIFGDNLNKSEFYSGRN